MRSERLTPAQLERLRPEDLAGAVLLAPVVLPDGALPEGTRLDPDQGAALQRSAARIPGPIPLAWLDPDDLHADEAAWRLARSVGGQGTIAGAPVAGRVELTAERPGVVHINVEPLSRLNRIEPIAVSTRPHGSTVRAGEVVASVRIAPAAVPAGTIRKGEAFATGNARLVRVAPVLPLEVGVIIAEDEAAGSSFEARIRARLAACGAKVDGVVRLPPLRGSDAEAQVRSTLEYLVLQRRLPVLIIEGISSGDLAAPFFSALEALGGQLLRRGVPAEPGGRCWLAELSGARILGAPTAADLGTGAAGDRILPRLLTGEAVTAETLAELGHGGSRLPAGRWWAVSGAGPLREGPDGPD